MHFSNEQFATCGGGKEKAVYRRRLLLSEIKILKAERKVRRYYDKDKGGGSTSGQKPIRRT